MREAVTVIPTRLVIFLSVVAAAAAIVIPGVLAWGGPPALPGGAAEGGRPPPPGQVRAKELVYRYDYSRTGHDGGPAPRELRLLWAFVAGDGRHYLSSPIVRDGRVYGASCVLDVFGSYGSVFCLDARGRKVWETEKVNDTDLKAFFSSPAITADGKYLVIGQGLHADVACDLLCLETATGRVRWKAAAPLNHFEGSPAVRGDMVVAGAGAAETDDGRPPKGPGLVIAVRISDGRKLWEYPVVDPESSPAIADDGTVYIGSGIGGRAVVALRSETDQELARRGLKRLLWKAGVDYPATGAVTLAGDRALLGMGRGDYVRPSRQPAGAVICLDRRSGRKLWQTPLGDAVLGAVAVRGGRAVAPIRSGRVAALRLSDGRVLWKAAVRQRAAVLSGPAFTGSGVYVVTNDGWLIVLDASDGKVLEKHLVNAAKSSDGQNLCLSSPLIVGGRLYVGSETGGLRCYAGKPQH